MKGVLYRCMRVVSLVLVASLATSLLMYLAPGYFSDEREMDAAHAAAVRTELTELRTEQHSPMLFVRHEAAGWIHGDLGRSRHFGVPVSTLLRGAVPYTAALLATALPLGWAVALSCAIFLSALRRRFFEVLSAGSTALVLALPVGALATLALVMNWDKPRLVLATVIAVRDFKILYRLTQTAWRTPHVFYARVHGLKASRIAAAHLLPMLHREVLSIGAMSVALALSSAVPIEVLFDRHGIGKLAWDAAMNRDLPVLTAVTGLVAGCVGLSGLFADPGLAQEADACV